ncbi:MAG: hypothetical protein R6W96_10070 [Clostridia bacterium]
MTTIKKVHFCGWENCHLLANGQVGLIVTADVGPRVLSYGFLEKENELCQVWDQMGKTGSGEWLIYGGHRLWHSPEAMPRSYWPDNHPVDVREIENGVEISQPVEMSTLVKKDIRVVLDPGSSKVTLDHMLTNKGLWDIRLAAWALTVMATGGCEIVPQTLTDTGLLPNRMLSLWPYTRLDDPRVTFGEKYILLRQDPKATSPFKFGISNTRGWAAYANHGHLFVKKFTHVEQALYPDYSGSSYETYTTDFMLEMESLSPLTVLAPGETLVHTETWELFDDVEPPRNEQDVDERILGLIE